MPNSIYDDWGLDFGSLEVQDLISRYADNDDSISIRRGNYGTMYQQEPIPYDTQIIIDRYAFKPKTQYYLSIDDDREMKNQIKTVKAIIDNTDWKTYSYSDMEYFVDTKTLSFDIHIEGALGRGLDCHWNTLVAHNLDELFNLYKYYRIANNIYTYFSQYHQDWDLDISKRTLKVKNDGREMMYLVFDICRYNNYAELKMHIYSHEYVYGQNPSSTIIFKSTGNRDLEDLSDFLKYFDGLILEVLNYGKVNS